ncbi:MAG: hypothetical protein QOC57_130, partial [Ilumatobacteraceae bacterium]
MRRLGASVTAALLAAGSFVVPMGGGSTAHAAVPPSFVAPLGGTISGQVTDDRGAPLSAVSVQIVGSGSRQVQTGADGRYSASSLPDGSYRVSVDTGHPNPVNNTSYSAYPELIDVTATTGQTGVDFELPRPAIVTGTVRNEGGTPVGNAVVLGLNGYYMPVAGDGQYLGTTTAGTHTLGVGAPGYVGWSVSPGFFYTQADVTTTVGQRTSVDVTLDAGGSISGHLMGSDGMPAMGAFVSASQINPVGVGSYGTTTTDQTGFYEIKALLAGDYSVVATSSATSAAGAVYYPGTPDWKAAAPVTVIDAAVTPSIDFALPAPVPLGPPITVASMSPMIFYRGTTTTATITGTGFVAGSNLRIDRWGPGSPPEISVVQVVDSEHVLVSVSVPADAWLNGEGGIYVMQLGQFAELQGVPFVADAGSSFGTISGRVTRASDGTPVANVRVAAESLNGPAPFDPATVTRADGTYVLGPLPPGEYAVRFSPGWPTYDLAAEFYPDAKTDLTKAAVSVSGDADTPGIDAVLEPATTGVVTAASPSVLQPGSTTDVTLTGTGFGIDDHVYVSGATYESWAPRVVSEQLVSSTEVHVQVEVGALSPSMQLSVNTPPHGGGFVSQCFCLSIAATPPSTGLLAGSIVDPVGDGLRSIRVSATLDGQTAPTTTVWTGQDGTYALRLPAGAYTIHSQDLAGAIVDSGPITVGVGDTVQAGTTTWAVPAAIGTLSGTVTDASNGVVIDGALVEATNVSTHEATAVLSHGGVYQFPTLPAGDYTLEFAHPGYESRWYNGATSSAAATSVTVVAGSVTSAVDQGLPLSRRSLSVSALQPNRVAQGESISNVVISGAGFVLGDVTNLSFSAGDGVSIAGVTTVDDTTATVSVVVAPNATIGPHDVIATRDDGQQATCTGCLRVFAGLASIGGTVALSDGRSSVINVSVVSQTTGETFRVGAAPGPWTIDRLPADSYRVGFSTYGYVDQWYDNVDAPAAATPVVVGNGPVVGINATMAVARKYLSLWGISPFVIQQGSQTAVTITGQGFLDGGVTGLTIDAGVGVTVQGINVLSDSSATATLTVAADAVLGVRPLKGSRDDGTTSTCFACLNIVPAAGHISGHVTGTNGLAFGSVDAFRVGDLSPSTAVVRPDGTYSFDQLQAGDYQLRFNGYGTNYVFAYTTEWWNDASTQAAATTISITAGQTVSGIDAQLSVPSSPLSLAQYFASYDAYQGMTRTVSLFGTGFLNGVTGLAFSAGPGISIVAGTISSDTVANVTITADPGAALGLRDITVTRGDGQTATCTQCLDVVTPPPGNVVATVLDVDTGASVYGAATISPVGDPTPVWSSPVYGSLYAYGLAAGEYDLTIDAAYYTPFTTRVTVVTGQTTYLPVVYMQTIRQPLTFNSPSSLPVYQSYPAQFYVTGTGFRFGGVTGLTFSAGADVAVDISAILSDGAAW